MARKSTKPNEAIVNMLIGRLLLDDIGMKLIEKSTSLDEKTIYARFPMKMINQAKVQ
jgi:hypothetical protein